MNEKEVSDCTIFECIGGSHAYGTNIETSDVDVRGVCVPADPGYYVGMGMISFEQKDSWENGDDKVIYDLRKILKLMADGNPNCIDLLFADPKHFIKCDVSWEKVLDIRDSFLSKKMRFTYGGYAYAQLKRIKNHRNYLLNPPKKKPERSDFGLPEKHLISPDQSGAYQWLLAKVLHDSIEYMKISDDAKTELLGINYIGAIQSGVPESAMQAVKEVTGASDAWVDSVFREKKYENAKKGWHSYQKWKSGRNAKRKGPEEKYGFDTKHAMHLVRLMRMGIEILETGKVHILRPDAEELLSIRHGAWSYDQVEEFAEKSDKKLQELYKTSSLPKSSNRKKIDKLCQDIIGRKVFLHL